MEQRPFRSDSGVALMSMSLALMMMLFRAPASEQPIMDEAKARRILAFESRLWSQLLRMEELLRRGANCCAELGLSAYLRKG